jgi:hypothetical protein
MKDTIKEFAYGSINFLFIIDKNGLLVSAKNLINNDDNLTACKGQKIDLVEYNIKFQALSKKELIEKCMFFIDAIKWEKIKTCTQLETVLNVVW